MGEGFKDFKPEDNDYIFSGSSLERNKNESNELENKNDENKEEITPSEDNVLDKLEWWKSEDPIEVAWGQLNEKKYMLEGGGWEYFRDKVSAALGTEVHYYELKGNPNEVRNRLYTKIKEERPDLLEKIPYNKEMFQQKEVAENESTNPEQSSEHNEKEPSSIESGKVDNLIREAISELYKANMMNATQGEMRNAIDKTIEKLLSVYDTTRDEIVPEKFK